MINLMLLITKVLMSSQICAWSSLLQLLKITTQYRIYSHEPAELVAYK